MRMHLVSPAFRNGEALPVRFTCEGADVSPPLAWSNVPKETQSFALFCEDPDAPGGTFHHWAIYDIPAATMELPEAFLHTGTVGPMHQGINDFGKTGYGGACPPKGHGIHHYHFKLLALDVGLLDARGKRCSDITKAARPHTIAEAELVGLYMR